MCVESLLIINNGLIPGGQNSYKRKSVFFLPIDPRNKDHKDPECTNHVVHKTFMTHGRNIKTLYIGRNRSCESEKIDILSDSIECNHPSKNTSSLLSFQLRHDWTRRIGFSSCSTAMRRSCSTATKRSCSISKIPPTNQAIPNPIRDRSGRPGITQDVIGVQDEEKKSRSQEIRENSLNEELCSSDRSGRPSITQDVISVQACSSEDNKNLNVEQTHDRSDSW